MNTLPVLSCVQRTTVDRHFELENSGPENRTVAANHFREEGCEAACSPSPADPVEEISCVSIVINVVDKDEGEEEEKGGRNGNGC